MARKKAAHEAAAKKAKKQKKLLMVLALPLLGAGFYAYTTLSSMGQQPTPVSATPAAATTPASSIPSAATTAPVVAGVAATPIDSLRTFTVLGRKDPFHDHGPNPAAAPDTSSSGKDSGKGKGDKGSSKPSQPSGPLTGAVISINGKKLALAVGTEFGHAPGLSGVSLFRLVKVTRTTALIGVVGTRQQFTLHVRHPLTLQQTGGWTYTLTLEPPGTAAPMTVAGK